MQLAGTDCNVLSIAVSNSPRLALFTGGTVVDAALGPLASLPVHDSYGLYVYRVSGSTIGVRHAAQGWQVTWDGDASNRIDMPRAYAGSVQSLCGRFDGDVARETAPFASDTAFGRSFKHVPPVSHPGHPVLG